ncbi:hypothetical protein V1499_23140 (plasmid) [Neobacillus sp. SCS-31]|uniref:hypothetical protein n=1 Tax=Neobacillus oceani TaxID=3115292 RepID=UPI0039068E27
MGELGERVPLPGLYYLQFLSEAKARVDELSEEAQEVIQALYDDISPSITQIDRELQRFYVQSTYPDTMAIRIIEKKDMYKELIQKEQAKAMTFEKAMKTLTNLERSVVQAHYYGGGTRLELSTEQYERVLNSAQWKLYSFLQEEA